MKRRWFILSCSMVLGGMLAPSRILAWEPHREITQAALAVLPERERWERLLGKENLQHVLVDCSMLPDLCYPFMAAAQWDEVPEVINARPLKTFYADDYVLIRALPRRIGHSTGELLKHALEAPYRRSLQAFRTETPLHACRQIGPLLHYIQDAGSPPHANPKCPHHISMELFRYLNAAEAIRIDGYRAQLLGKTDEEALLGLRKRIEGLVAFSSERSQRGLDVWPDRQKLEPILLESAMETARVCADFLYTMFTLGLAPQPEGGVLTGTITAGEFPINDLELRVVLVDTEYSTSALCSGDKSVGAAWAGTYLFHHLPPGEYRVLAYRTGSQMALSAPVRVEVGKSAKVDLHLAPTDPPRNMVYNPDATLRTLVKDRPDRWEARSVGKQALWTSAIVPVVAGKIYRCGVVRRDPNAQVRFVFRTGADLRDVQDAAGISSLADWFRLPPEIRRGQGDYALVPKGDPVVFSLPVGHVEPKEICFPVSPPYTAGVVVEVQTEKPSLPEAIQQVWIVPEEPPPPAGSRP